MIPASSVNRISRTMRRALVVAALLAAFGVPLAYAQEVTTTGETTTGATTTDEAPPPTPLHDGVTIAGVPVGGLTPDEARVAVRAFFARPFTFTFHRHVKTATPWWVGGAADVATALANASVAAPGQAVDLAVKVNRTRLRAFVARLARSWNRAPVSSTAHLRGLRPVLTRARVGFKIR